MPVVKGGDSSVLEDPRIALIREMQKKDGSDRPMSPKSQKWVKELGPVLEPYNYTPGDISSLVKKFNYNSDLIEEAVINVLDERKNHEAGDFQEYSTKKQKKKEPVKGGRVPGMLDEDGQNRSNNRKRRSAPQDATHGGPERGRGGPRGERPPRRDGPSGPGGRGGRPDRPPRGPRGEDSGEQQQTDSPVEAEFAKEWDQDNNGASRGRQGHGHGNGHGQQQRPPVNKQLLPDSKWASAPATRAWQQKKEEPPRSRPQTQPQPQQRPAPAAAPAAPQQAQPQQPPHAPPQTQQQQPVYRPVSSPPDSWAAKAAMKPAPKPALAPAPAVTAPVEVKPEAVAEARSESPRQSRSRSPSKSPSRQGQSEQTEVPIVSVAPPAVSDPRPASPVRSPVVPSSPAPGAASAKAPLSPAPAPASPRKLSAPASPRNDKPVSVPRTPPQPVVSSPIPSPAPRTVPGAGPLTAVSLPEPVGLANLGAVSFGLPKEEKKAQGAVAAPVVMLPGGPSEAVTLGFGFGAAPSAPSPKKAQTPKKHSPKIAPAAAPAPYEAEPAQYDSLLKTNQAPAVGAVTVPQPQQPIPQPSGSQTVLPQLAAPSLQHTGQVQSQQAYGYSGYPQQGAGATGELPPGMQRQALPSTYSTGQQAAAPSQQQLSDAYQQRQEEVYKMHQQQHQQQFGGYGAHAPPPPQQGQRSGQQGQASAGQQQQQQHPSPPSGAQQQPAHMGGLGMPQQQHLPAQQLQTQAKHADTTSAAGQPQPGQHAQGPAGNMNYPFGGPPGLNSQMANAYMYPYGNMAAAYGYNYGYPLPGYGMMGGYGQGYDKQGFPGFNGGYDPMLFQGHQGGAGQPDLTSLMQGISGLANASNLHVSGPGQSSGLPAGPAAAGQQGLGQLGQSGGAGFSSFLGGGARDGQAGAGLGGQSGQQPQQGSGSGLGMGMGMGMKGPSQTGLQGGAPAKAAGPSQSGSFGGQGLGNVPCQQGQAQQGQAQQGQQQPQGQQGQQSQYDRHRGPKKFGSQGTPQGPGGFGASGQGRMDQGYGMGMGLGGPGYGGYPPQQGVAGFGAQQSGQPGQGPQQYNYPYNQQAYGQQSQYPSGHQGSAGFAGTSQSRNVGGGW